MASIGRRIKITECNGQRVNEAGEFEDFHVTLFGSYTPERATRRLRREYHDTSITINQVEESSAYHKMDIEKFIAESERVD